MILVYASYVRPTIKYCSVSAPPESDAPPRVRSHALKTVPGLPIKRMQQLPVHSLHAPGGRILQCLRLIPFG